MSLVRRLVAAGALTLAAAVPVAASAALTVTSPAFADGTKMPTTFAFAGNPAANQPSCGGNGTSPPIAWSGAPAATRSFAVLAWDPDGRKGLGVSHMVVYNIPGTATSIAQGAAATTGTAGKTIDAPAWRGLCPPPGSAPHHYTFQVFALDADLQLPPGLDRTAVLAAIGPHIIEEASVIGTYAR